MVGTIRNKFIIVFMLFSISLFLVSFRKLKEKNDCIHSCFPGDCNTTDKIVAMTDCKKVRGRCLSLNCNKPLNSIFNVTLTGNKVFDDKNQDLAAYCCKSCRDTGGCKCDTTCESHSFDVSDDKCPDFMDNTESFKGIKEGLSTEEHGNIHHDSIIQPTNAYMTYQCEDNGIQGILDQGSCDCYSGIDSGGKYDYDTTPVNLASTNCGDYRFHQCYTDPSCVASFNALNMSSFKEIEPGDNTVWGSNIMNIVTNSYFNHDLGPKTIYDRFANLEGNPISLTHNLKEPTFNGKYFCEDVCLKAADQNNQAGQWNDRPDLLDDDGIPTACAVSDVVWAASFLCRKCKSYDGNDSWPALDPNMQQHNCTDGAELNNSKELTDQIDFNWVDKHGKQASDSFLNEIDENGNYAQWGTIINPIGTIPNERWSSHRDQSHLQFYCKAACGQQLRDKCHNGYPTGSESENIRGQCEAACKKRLPCAGTLKRLAALISPGSADASEPAPEFSEDAEYILPGSDAGSGPLHGSKYKDGTSVSWNTYRDDIFGIKAADH
tara:strand:+ start:3244 stop:4887 length:1644 start_codon:yes stop_codon:yes gene_type:complete